MKKINLLTIVWFFCTSMFAQQALWGGQSIVSPEIHPDNTVTFRFFAPAAKSVQVTGDFLSSVQTDTPFGKAAGAGSTEMTKNGQGVWEYTTPRALPSELYGYSFVVDGVKVTDPNNVYQVRDVATITNIFIIKGGQADLYTVNKVPHGTVARRWYNSPTLKTDRRITIYTPPGYENSKEKYPVFYLLHGMGGDEESWMTLGRTAQIMDNLIAQGKAKPMIVVMPNGNPAQEAAPGESSDNLVKPTMQLPNTMDGTTEASFPDIVKFIEDNYRTQNNKAGRAIAGLSMGGYHALHISKQYPDMFDYIGLFSAAIDPAEDAKSDIYADSDGKLNIQFEHKPKLYWIAIGSEDFLYEQNKEYRRRLDRSGYKYTYVESDEGHIWKNWRIYLTQFVPLLFR